MDYGEQYLIALRADGKTPATLSWHRQSLRQLYAWLDAEAQDLGT